MCGGVLASADSVVLDLGSMNSVRNIDPSNLLASFDAGVRGSDAEDVLSKAGLTLGLSEGSPGRGGRGLAAYVADLCDRTSEDARR